MSRGYKLLKEKVPAFQTPWKATAILAGWILLFLLCILFFWWFDPFSWYSPLVSQSLVAVLCCAFAYAHMRYAVPYRNKYKEKAYQYFFFHFIVPIFATWYAMLVHPLLVGGEPFLPFWAAVVLGVFFLLLRPLTASHISRSGFDTIGHGFGIYTVYPEEGPLVSSKIYSYVRHPMYLGSFCAALGLAFLRNNMTALATALVFLIPILVEVHFEDSELVRRSGDEHKHYIKNTGALFPHRDVAGFFKLLFLGKDDSSL
jgi:protein-S-isoprenylcysteine O-methyltransferase Ste14